MKTYKKPVLNVEHFVPNEFVAACHDENLVYKFECDAGDGVYGGVWQETNGIDGLQTNWTIVNGQWYSADKQISRSTSSFHACGKTHEASTEDDFLDGYYLASKRGSSAIPVKIWTEGGTNVHCTTNLNTKTWETAKS